MEGREIGDGGGSGGIEIVVVDGKARLDAKTKARLERASRARTRSRQQQRAEVATREQQRQTQAGAGGASATEVEEAQPIGPVDAKPLLPPPPPPPPLQADLEKSKTTTVARSWLACSTLECEPNDHLHPSPSWRPEGLTTASARSRRATTRPMAFERGSCCDHYQLDWVT